MEEININDTIRNILGQLNILAANHDNINDNDDLFQLGLNSINIIEMIVKIEEAFDIEFSDEDLSLEGLQTIKKLENYVKNKIGR
jgi:acyl carrier protein